MNKPKLTRSPEKCKEGKEYEELRELNTPAYDKRDFLCPDYFNEEETAEWAELVALIKSIKNGAVTDADRKQMIIRCQSWVEYKRFDRILKDRLDMDLDDVKKYFDMRKKAAEIVIKCDSNLGLDPISRARIGLARVKADKDNANEVIGKLLNRKGDND